MPANNPHQTVLEAQLPQWARQATPEQWATLPRTQVAPWQAQDWFANSPRPAPGRARQQHAPAPRASSPGPLTARPETDH